MEKKTEEIQICRPDDLSDEIRNELASAQDHFCMKDDKIYLQVDHSVFRFPNNPSSKELVFSISKKIGNKCMKPCSYTEVFDNTQNIWRETGQQEMCSGIKSIFTD